MLVSDYMKTILPTTGHRFGEDFSVDSFCFIQASKVQVWGHMLFFILCLHVQVLLAVMFTYLCSTNKWAQVKGSRKNLRYSYTTKTAAEIIDTLFRP